ncbi:MAG: hypothetical protein F4Y94_09815 [Chloroflexi bacterium]|nr:hypothetical protein [Chloroflexota bacterium]
MTPGTLAWLDYSQADQRRAREIVAMFSQRESRDELGLGGIRDALSDTLFPGTSVLLTRARYFLFVPWLFREGERRGYHGPRLVTWVDGRERRLIEALQSGGDVEGLIGRFAGPAVQILPSTIYWNSLRRFGFLRHEGTIAQVAGHRQISRPAVDATEYIESTGAVWAPSIPPAPDDFFRLEECDFSLTREEATWLAERIVDAVPDTLLQFLVLRGTRPSAAAQFAWQEPEARDAPEHIRGALAQARRFAVTMHGAALLYNVILAERAAVLGLTDHAGQHNVFTSRLDEWRGEIEASDVASWDLDSLWALVAEQGRPVPLRTRSFVTEWVDAARRQTGSGLANDQRARALVTHRELHQKGSQARLRNDRLMRQWGGASGTERLNFRWPFLARLLRDIADGRERNHAGP